MYEHRHQPLLPRRQFIIRELAHIAAMVSVISGSLVIGIAGYHYLNNLSWVDAFVNASMILAGMGPIDPLINNTAKLFAGCYALFSGLIFIISAGIMLAPIAHRLFHHFHLMDEGGDTTATEQ